MEIYKSIVIICFTINVVAFSYSLRRIAEAWLTKKAEYSLEVKRLELKAHLINEREQRIKLFNAERLIDAAREGGEY